MFSSGFCEMSKNSLFADHLWETASAMTVSEVCLAFCQTSMVKSFLEETVHAFYTSGNDCFFIDYNLCRLRMKYGIRTVLKF